MDENRADMVVEINEVDTSAEVTELVQYSECADERRESPRPRLPLGAKLIALRNLLFEIIVGVPYVFLMAWVGDDFGAGAVIICSLIFAAAHTAASVVLYGRYKRKYGVAEWKYALLNALPALILGAMICVVIYLMGQYKTLDFGTAILIGIPAECFAGYSAVYGALLSVALGIRYSVKKKRN